MPDSITINLTDSRPIKVNKALWPLVARATEAEDHNRQELFRRYYLRVRLHGRRAKENQLEYYGSDKDLALALHRDQRAIVYGWYESSWQGEEGARAGYVCLLDEAPSLIRQVAEAIGAPEYLITACCGDLPPIDETGESEELMDAISTEELEAELSKRTNP